MEAGEPGRGLANGDLLRIDAVTPAGLLVRRALDADPATGRRRWTDRQFLYAHYQEAELGYAVTDHAAQGRTVHTGLALITGIEDRQHAYVALTRGTHDNTAYVYTRSSKRADIGAPESSPSARRAAGGIPSPSANDSKVDVALGFRLPVLHSLSRPWGRPVKLRDHSLGYPVRLEQGDDRAEITPGACVKNLLPCAGAFHDPAHLGDSQSHGVLPVPLGCSPSIAVTCLISAVMK